MQVIPVLIVLLRFAHVNCMSQSLPTGILFAGRDANSFKVQLQHSLEGARIRRKRQAGLLTSVSDTGFTADHLRVGGSAPGDLPYLSGHNLTMWTSTRFQGRDQIFIGTRHGSLVLLDVTEKGKTAQHLAHISYEAVGLKVRAFSYGDQQWFVVLVSMDAYYGIQLYQVVGSVLERRQYIHLDGEADFDLITVKGIHYLAVSTYRTMKNHGYSYQGIIRLYHWTRTQFDVIAFRETYGARSVVCWSLDGALYLAVSQETNDAGDVLLGSPVYLFNAKDGESLVFLDKLRTKGPRKVAHFSVAGSHYLIFIGQDDAQIFWWTTDQFLLWQTVPNTAGASEVSVLALQNGEVVLVIAVKAEMLFFTLDAKGYYKVTFTMQISGFMIESLQFIFDGLDYYALALFEASDRPLPHPIWKLKMDSYNIPNADYVDSLIHCLSNLRDDIKNRENELEAVELDMDRIWLTNKDQVLVTDVVVKGSAIAPHFSADEVVIKSNYSHVETTPSIIEHGISSGLVEIGLFDDKLDDILYKSKDQLILGSKTFTNYLSVPSVHWLTVPDDVVINDVSVSRLVGSSLKKSGYQVFQNRIGFNKIHASSVHVSALNGIAVDDIVLLNGAFGVTGKWQFGHLIGSNFTAASINNLAIGNLVTLHNDQDIEELKVFISMAANTVAVHELTNGEDLSALQSQMVTLDTAQDVQCNLEFKSSLTVEGDLSSLGHVDGEVDLSVLDDQSVRKSLPQMITGKNTFARGALVTNEVSLKGLLNGINLNDLVTRHTWQNLTGTIRFSGTDISQNVLVNFINAKDLDALAVVRSKDQFVEGIKFFDSLITNDIEASNGVEIDGIDVSEAAQILVKHNQGIIENSNPVFFQTVVLGNVTAHGGINGFWVSDIPTVIWLKSFPQSIVAPVHVTHFTAENDLIASTVKGYNLETEVLHVFGNEGITVNKVFQHRIHVTRNFDIVEGKLLDGIDVYSFREDEYFQKQFAPNTVYGMKVIPKVEIYGDIEIGKVNDLGISQDFMKPTDSQIISGDIQILSQVAAGEHLHVNSIRPVVFNNEDFATFASQVVWKDNIYPREMNSKLYVHLNANHVSVSEEGLLDGVSLADFIRRVVLLNSPQQASGEKDFADEVTFVNESLATMVNGINLNSLVSRVVFTDSVGEVHGKKIFSGNSIAGNLNAYYLNGINVTQLAIDVMSKTRENIVLNSFIFDSDLNIDSLSVVPPAKLDSVALDDVVLVANDLNLSEMTSFFANVMINSDLFVYGLANGCNLNEISSYALRADSLEPQVLPEYFGFGLLNVYGNLDVPTINQIALDELKANLIGDAGHQILAGDLHIYPGASTTYLNLVGSVNMTDLGSLMGDAITKTTSQVITSCKIFHDDLEVNVISSHRLITSGTLNGIDLKELSEKTVWKDGYQTIVGEKSFGEITAQNATFHGYLNGIRIPYDVVLAIDQETLPENIQFMKDIEIHSDLAVHGLIDSTDLITSWNSVVNLYEDQTILSDVRFVDNVHVRSATVDGLVNNIKINTVVRTNGDIQIGGYKTFNDLTVGNLAVSVVNGFDLNGLLANVVSRARDERLASSQIFMQSIQAQDQIVVDWINGVSLQPLLQHHSVNQNNLETYIDGLKTSGSSQGKAIDFYLAGSQYRLSDFAYFILQQEIDIRGSVRVIALDARMHLAGEMRQTLALWTSNVHCSDKRCCNADYTYWLSVDSDGRVVPSSGPQSGRYFPLQYDATSGHSFFVWTNSTSSQPQWCHTGNEEMAIGSFSNAGHFEKHFRIVGSPSLVDVRSFIDGYTYVVASYYYDNANNAYGSTVVYLGDVSKYVWQVHQNIPVYGVLSMDLAITIHDGYTDVLLALGSGLGNYPDSYFSVYKWNRTSSIFELVQSVPSQNVASLLWIHAGGHLLLAVAGVDNWSGEATKCTGVIEGGQLDVYSYDSGLTWMQSIPVQGVTSMASLTIEGNTYLAAVSRQTEMVHVLQWKGFNRFTVIQSLHSSEARHVSAHQINNHFYLSLSGGGSTKVLKAVIRGEVAEGAAYDVLSELGDQPADSLKSNSTC